MAKKITKKGEEEKITGTPDAVLTVEDEEPTISVTLELMYCQKSLKDLRSFRYFR